MEHQNKATSELGQYMDNRASATGWEAFLTWNAELGMRETPWLSETRYCVSHEWDECGTPLTVTSRSLWDRQPQSGQQWGEKGRERIWTVWPSEGKPALPLGNKGKKGDLNTLLPLSRSQFSIVSHSVRPITTQRVSGCLWDLGKQHVHDFKGFLVIEKEVEHFVPVAKWVGGDAFLWRRELKH